MPPWPADGELPPPGDAAFDALLDRAPLPGDAAAGLHQLAAAFGELYAAPVPSSPAAEQHAVAAFRAAAGQPGPAAAPTRPARSQAVLSQAVPSRPAPSRPAPSRPARSRPGRRRARVPRLSARIAAIGAALVVSLGGAAAVAAYSGALPDMLHRLTQHHPASPPVLPHPSPAEPTTESRSAAPGPAAGLCTAYQHALAHGSPGEQRRAFSKLAAAAGGAGHVTAYCAGVGQATRAPGGLHTHPAHPPHPTHPAHPPHPPHPPHPAHPAHPAHGHKQASAG